MKIPTTSKNPALVAILVPRESILYGRSLVSIEGHMMEAVKGLAAQADLPADWLISAFIQQGIDRWESPF
jgi:hypothetical protein